MEPLLQSVRETVGADAVTVAIRTAGDERLLVCTSDGRVREATGSLSLGLVASGPRRLSGGAGLLQAVESYCLFGFTPAGYLGAPFRRRRTHLTGGLAAWTRRTRRWTVADRSLLRQLAIHCENEILPADEAAVA